MIRLWCVFFVVILSVSSCFAQVASTVPCGYSGQILRDSQGKVLVLPSDQMKARATHKEELSGPVTQVDVKITVVAKILVDTDGTVACMDYIRSHPIVSAGLEGAIRKWRFLPAKSEGKPIHYLGVLEFSLCNISCGEEGRSMTLLK